MSTRQTSHGRGGRHDPVGPALPAEVAAFRQAFQAEHVGPRYSGWLHFFSTSAGSLLVIGFAISRLHHVRPLEWLTVPLAFFVANLAEYFGHKGAMHHRRRGLGLLFERHARQHHRYYTRRAMAAQSSRDFKMVLFPAPVLLFFLLGVGAPLALLCFWLVSANAGWLFLAVAVGYFLTYEWLHLAYHLGDIGGLGWVGRLGLIRRLRRHHARHHDPRLMQHWNFNITFPIGDWIFGTAYAPGAGADAADEE